MAHCTINPLFWTLAHIGSRISSSAPTGVEDPVLTLPHPR